MSRKKKPTEHSTRPINHFYVFKTADFTFLLHYLKKKVSFHLERISVKSDCQHNESSFLEKMAACEALDYNYAGIFFTGICYKNQERSTGMCRGNTWQAMQRVVLQRQSRAAPFRLQTAKMSGWATKAAPEGLGLGWMQDKSACLVILDRVAAQS